MEETAPSIWAFYEKQDKVGEGPYCKVYKAKEKATGKIVALKKIGLPDNGDGVSEITLRDISIFRMLSTGDHVVRMLDVINGVNRVGETVLYLVFDYLDTDLKEFISNFKDENIPEETVKILMFQLSKGVAFCHGHGVLHGCLSPSILLMDKKTMALKIPDLQLASACILKKNLTELPSPCYIAPEVLLGDTNYSNGVDMWSVGCIFAELMTKKALFSGDSQEDQLHSIFTLLGAPNEKMLPGVSKLKNWHEYQQWRPQNLCTAVPGLDEDGLDLLARMLQYEPGKRISARKALQHRYFKDFCKKD